MAAVICACAGHVRSEKVSILRTVCLPLLRKQRHHVSCGDAQIYRFFAAVTGGCFF